MAVGFLALVCVLAFRFRVQTFGFTGLKPETMLWPQGKQSSLTGGALAVEAIREGLGLKVLGFRVVVGGILG